MLGYLSLDIICSSKLTVFLELRSQKTVRFSEQIMSADKYPSIFSRQMETIVYIIQDLHGSCKTFRSRVTKNNFLTDLRFRKIKLGSHASREYSWTPLFNCKPTNIWTNFWLLVSMFPKSTPRFVNTLMQWIYGVCQRCFKLLVSTKR